MNIFVLDEDIEQCAQYHCDQHVVKMILESVQMLCTALNKKGFVTPYKSTHVNHPCVLWVEESFDNFLWLKKLAIELNTEYRIQNLKILSILCQGSLTVYLTNAQGMSQVLGYQSLKF